MNTPQKFESERHNSERWPKRWPNDDHFLSFWVLIDTSPQRARNGFLAGKNYSIHFHCCCCGYFFFCCCSFCCFCFYLFQSLAHFMSTNTKPSGTIGDTQKTMTISATSFRGCNRFSPLLIWYDIYHICNLNRIGLALFSEWCPTSEITYNIDVVFEKRILAQTTW